MAVKKKVKKKSAAGSSSQMERPVVSQGDFAYASDGCAANRVFVCMAKTVNIGNYESMRLEYGFGRAVPEGGSFEEVKNECQADALRSLHEMCAIVEGKLKK